MPISVKPSKEYLNWFKINLIYNSNTGSLVCRTKINQKREVGDIYTKSDGAGYLKIVVKINGKSKYFRAHNVAWFLHYGIWPYFVIDHRDGNGENNKIKNMRKSNDNENCRNRKIIHNKCGHRGIRVKKYISRKYEEVIYYQARIFYKNKRISLGSFKNLDQAIKARIDGENKYFKEFAFSNRKRKTLPSTKALAFALIAMFIHVRPVV